MRESIYTLIPCKKEAARGCGGNYRRLKIKKSCKVILQEKEIKMKCHLCDYCFRRPSDLDMTHLDSNSCSVARQVIESEEAVDNNDLWKFLHKPGFKGKKNNDAEYCPEGFPDTLAFKTEDNGSGYDITECFSFFFDTSKYSAYLKSETWKKKRLEAIERDGFQCRICGSAKNLNVHHLTYKQVPNEPLDDLLTVCEKCHSKLHRNDFHKKQ